MQAKDETRRRAREDKSNISHRYTIPPLPQRALTPLRTNRRHIPSKIAQIHAQRHLHIPWASLLRTPDVRTGSLSRRILDTHQHLLAVLDLVHHPLVQLRHRGVRDGREEGFGHDLCEGPAGHDVVLVDVGDAQAAGGEDDLRVIVEVELHRQKRNREFMISV